MNIDEIKKISLVEFLNQLGYRPAATAKVYGFTPRIAVRENRRSMSIHARMFGLTLGRARAATSSRLPEKCPVKRTF